MYDRCSWYATPVPVDLSTSRSFPFHDPLPVQWILYIQLMTQRHTPTETHKQISSGLSKLPCRNDHRLMTGCKTSLTLNFLWLLSAKTHNSLTNCTSYQWIALHQRNLLYQVHHLLLRSILLAFYTIKQNNSQASPQYFTQLSTGINPSTSLELCSAWRFTKLHASTAQNCVTCKNGQTSVYRVLVIYYKKCGSHSNYNTKRWARFYSRTCISIPENNFEITSLFALTTNTVCNAV